MKNRRKLLVQNFDLIFILIIIILTVFYIQATTLYPIIQHDLSSYLAPAVSLVAGNGAPYIDYFDIKPPMAVFSLVPWIFLFGSSLFGLIILDSIALSILFLLAAHFMRMIGIRIIGTFFFLYSVIYALSFSFFDMMLLTETTGLIFTLTAILIILKYPEFLLSWFVAGLFFIISGQIKEVYIFSPIILITLVGFNQRSFWIEGFTAFLGWCFGALLLFFLLDMTNSVVAYLDVLSYKAGEFQVRDPITMLLRIIRGLSAFNGSRLKFYLFLIPAMIISAYIFIGKYLRKENQVMEFKEDNHILLIYSVLLAALLLGFAWQGKPSSGHYAISIWFPYVMFIGAWFSVLTKELPRLAKRLNVSMSLNITSLILFGWFVSVLTPGPTFPSFVWQKFEEQLRSSGDWFRDLETEEDLSVYKLAAENLENDDCIQQIYGWASGIAYIYTGVKPCSRYFLANLITTKETQVQYVEDLERSPPKAVIYHPASADLDVAKFERNVFPWQDVISKCYEPSRNATLFFARSDKKQLQQCVRDILQH